MLDLCRILHFKHDILPSKVEAYELYQFARLVDKYAAGLATRPTVEAWLRAGMDDGGGMDRQIC